MAGLRTCRYVLLVLACKLLWGAGPVNTVQTLPGYLAELEHLAAAIDQVERHPDQAGNAVAALPDTWTVDAGGSTWEVSTAPFKIDLVEHRPESLARARRRLALMREEAAGYDREFFSTAVERTRLNAILGRREFRNVRGPTWMERLQQRALEFLARILGRIFGSSAFPTVSRIIVWALVGIAVVVLAIMAYRLIRRSARLETIMPEVLPVSAKEWSVWMAEARSAAAQGNWRDAIHLAYWAGISFLEAQGLWRPDRARTPREYLRLLPSSSGHGPALRALTRRFEVVWYGYQRADEQAFDQTVMELENLGCR